MPLPYPTEDELVDTLRRSNLPTVLVEGKGDMPIYRWVEERLGSRQASVQAAGDKNKLLAVFRRRQEFSHLPVAFVADRDMCLFSGIPSEYDGVIWTEGYSIENDLYTDAELENLLADEELQEHQQLRDAIVEWFAFEVEEYLAGRNYKVSNHCNEVVPLGQTKIDAYFRKMRGMRPPNEKIHLQILEKYRLQLRGKLLFQMLIRFLSESNRYRNFGYRKLYDSAFEMTPPHPLRDRLANEIERTITDQKTALRPAKPSQ